MSEALPYRAPRIGQKSHPQSNPPIVLPLQGARDMQVHLPEQEPRDFATTAELKRRFYRAFGFFVSLYHTSSHRNILRRIQHDMHGVYSYRNNTMEGAHTDLSDLYLTRAGEYQALVNDPRIGCIS